MESNTVVEEVAHMVKIGIGRPIKAENSSNPSSPNRKDPCLIGSKVPIGIGSGRSAMDINSIPSSSNQKDSNANNQDDQLESAKAEMGEVREENERLKTILARIVKDYQSLQMHFFDIVQQEQAKKPKETTSTTDQEMEEPEMVSLSLGTVTSGQKREEKTSNLSKMKDDEHLKEGLSLGLDCKFQNTESSANQSPENSVEESKEEETIEAWPPSKAMKMPRSLEDDVSQQTHVKKARVSVRTRCEAPTMNDGCQWRKYGQKISKGNPCPRAYYRCTVAPACPVRKQVQRCAEDMSILITTYEGTHNHPLPVSATAMASTTSAAAYMLVSGSSSSSPTSDLHGLNFSLSDPSRSSSKPFFLPNPSMSSSPSYPTITLDLTSPSSTSAPHFSRFSSSFSHNPRYSSTTFNFSSDSNASQNSWSNNNNYLSYGNQNLSKNLIGSSGNFLRNSQEQLYQPYLQKTNFTSPQPPLTETIMAATKAITSDPSFRSALAAAITSIVGGNGGGGGGVVENNVVQNLMRPETFSTIPSYSTTANGSGCGSSYLNRTSGSSSNSQQGSLMFLPPTLPFSSTKSASGSPVDNRENKG